MRKKRKYFDSGDLLVVKRRLRCFGRNAKGLKVKYVSIPTGERIIYLGAKMTPHATYISLYEETKGTYSFVKPVTIKILWDGSVWFFAIEPSEVYQHLKLCQKLV
jgi:hypothetical protein